MSEVPFRQRLRKEGFLIERDGVRVFTAECDRGRMMAVLPKENLKRNGWHGDAAAASEGSG